MHEHKIKMRILLLILLFCPILLAAQKNPALPVYDQSHLTIDADWLLAPVSANAQLFKTLDGKLVFSNGLVDRVFTLKPNGATVSLPDLVR